MSDAGYLAALIPEAYGGSGLPLSAAAVGASRLLAAMVVGLGLLTVLSPTLAHDGHDHGTSPAA